MWMVTRMIIMQLSQAVFISIISLSSLNVKREGFECMSGPHPSARNLNWKQTYQLSLHLRVPLGLSAP